MKKIILTFTALLIIGISAGILYFTVYRESKMELPKDVVMETAFGEEFAFAKMEPKVRLLEFMYINCPDICPTTTYKMKQLREDLKNDGVFGNKVEFITITVDPMRDTQEKLGEYARTFEIGQNEGWHLLRGSEEDTKKVADAFGFLYRDPGNGMLIHSSTTFFINEENEIIEVFGMGEKGFDKEEILKEIRKTLK
ncbi:SCO family protein [Bacillus timonensis]|nr:SCO family protein [Bacillus timonensis]